MNEQKKTLIFAGSAVLLALLALLTAPERITPDAFMDKGEPFFPEFTDPNTATTLEVIEFDEQTASPKAFKVTFEEGKWTIPSHHNYPADGKDRLAETAAGVISLRKDDFRSDNPADHQACGVLDPLDENVTKLEGRGRRITIRGQNGQILADIIIGKSVEGRENFRFVRVPEQKRIYAARMDFDVSTKFGDWIEKDLLKVSRNEIAEVVLKDYSIDEVTRRVNQRDVLTLERDNGTWSASRMKSDEEVNTSKTNNLLNAIDNLTIVGVRPKPAGLSASLTRASDGGIKLSQGDVLSLQSKGYFFSRDGQLLSNEGELQVRTKDAVIYTLRFGEVVYGEGEAVTAGVDTLEARQTGPAENRYLFITTDFDASQFPEPPAPQNTEFQNKPDSLWTDADRRNKELYDEHQEWQEKIDQGRERSQELNARFADWYYVISQDSYEKIRLTRSDLIKKKDD